MSESLSDAPPAARSMPRSVEESPLAHTGSRRQGWLRRVDLALLSLLALPLVILKLDDTWLFAYSAGEHVLIDSWIYFGYFLNLTGLLHAFRSGYFAGRLSWILPGFLAYRSFPPLAATYVLHVAFYWIAVVSLYLILKHTVGRRAAWLAALLMGCYCYFLWAIGWDYVDGAAATYTLLTLCALTYAAKAERPQRWQFMSGAAFAVAIYCHFFLISFVPLFALYYHFARREYWKDMPAFRVRPFAHGFIALTLFYAVINLVLKAPPLFFILPSLSAGGKLVAKGNLWMNWSLVWLRDAGWLVFPAVTLLGALLFVNLRGWRPSNGGGFRLLWQAFFVLSALIMLLWQISGQPVLQLVYYTSLLIPAMFLALGAQLAPALERLSRPQFAALCGAAAVLLLLPFAAPLHSGFIPVITQHRWLWPAIPGTVGVVLLARRVRYTGAVAVLLVCAACGTLNLAAGTRTWGQAGQPDDPAFEKQAFLAVVASVRAVRQIDPSGQIFFWYDFRAPLGPLHRSVASTFLWSRRLVSERFPLLGPKAETPYLKLKIPPPHTRIAILTVDESALDKAEQSLRELGLTARLLGQSRISEGAIGWNMILIETEKSN